MLRPLCCWSQPFYSSLRRPRTFTTICTRELSPICITSLFKTNAWLQQYIADHGRDEFDSRHPDCWTMSTTMPLERWIYAPACAARTSVWCIVSSTGECNWSVTYMYKLYGAGGKSAGYALWRGGITCHLAHCCESRVVMATRMLVSTTL